MEFILIADLSPFCFRKVASLIILNFKFYAPFCCSVLDVSVNPSTPSVVYESITQPLGHVGVR